MNEIFNNSLLLSFWISAVLGALVWMEKDIPNKKSLLGGSVDFFWWIRAHTMISVLWAMCVFLDQINKSFLFTPLWFIVVGLFISIPYIYSVFKKWEVSFASEYGALLTYFLWVFVMLWGYKIAIIFAVLLTLLVSSKDYFSSLRKKISREELNNTLKFAVIAFVILPILPDEKFSFATLLWWLWMDSALTWNNAVWQMAFINPYGIWFFVVAMSAIWFLWYIFTKIVGQKGWVMISSALGWLISSTAVTAAMAEKSKRYKTNNSIYVLGTLIASCIMFLRVILIIVLFNAALLVDISIPSLVMFFTLLSAVWYFYYKSRQEKSITSEVDIEKKVESPFQITPALKFAWFIIIIKFISWIWILYKEVWGEWIFYYILWIISGLADVDAITQTLAVESWDGNVQAKVAVFAILIAVMSNNLVKWSMAWKFWDKSYGKKVLISFLLSMFTWIVAIFAFVY